MIMTMIIFSLVASVLIIGLAILSYNQVFGQRSLQDLENQFNEETSYRAELEDYMVSHNMTYVFHKFVGEPMLKEGANLNISELEAIVKEHMEDCRSGFHDRMVKEFKNNEEMLGIFGDC